ncbi:LysE family translocator [Mesorhizobium sp. L-2-11]|uniref:LysE family translocator n=1 Tax=Mesorhizobium sp. L-2-11 TaxID=2744521 RepID=UPI001926578B|nr:LysE family translocator [Mesorhizobium sp. L-2-11]BCH15543.1 threonine efflux protein [Mesorhizobium sp. L-2-11]
MLADQFIIVFTAYVIAAGSPGPSNMRIMAVAMNDGRGAALAIASGVVSGSIFWGLMAATGVSAILSRYAQALVVLQLLGGLYLLYLLYLAFTAGKAALSSDKDRLHPTNERKATAATLYKRGLLMHLTNPKSILAWIALMTLGLGPGSSSHTVLVILAGCAVLSVTIFCGYAIVFSTAPMIALYRRARRWIEGTLAVFFGFAGLKLLLTRI